MDFFEDKPAKRSIAFTGWSAALFEPETTQDKMQGKNTNSFAASNNT